MKFYLISGVIITLIGVLTSIQSIKELDAKFNGEVIEAHCLESPQYCHRRNNRIKITFHSKEYSVIIGRKECRINEYKENSKYSFKLSDRFDHVITTKRKPEIMIPFLLFIFGIAIFCFWKMKKATNM